MRLLCAVLLLASGCATTIEVTRRQPALIEVVAPAPGVGILSVDADDEVMARAPNDFANMTGLVVKAAKDYLRAEAANFVAVDYGELGFTPKWVRSKSSNDPMLYRVDAMECVPAGVQTPLVTVVKVLDWRTYVETVDKISRDVARVSLVFSTWTKDGAPVRQELVTAEAIARVNGVRLTTWPDAGRLLTWFQRSGAYSSAWLPEDRARLFREALSAAVALHYFPFLPHTLRERYVLMDDGPLEQGVLLAQSGRYAEAKDAWLQVAAADERAHKAFYNAAVMCLVEGDDARADELLTRAVSIDDRLLYTDLLRSVRERLLMRKRVGQPPATSP